ncbi:MAG: HNH endonuclease signature motif containing protein [Bacteroidota bacterium]
MSQEKKASLDGLNDYIACVEAQMTALAGRKKTLSAVKKLILQTLWKAGDDSFPKPWVESALLLQKTKQKYFDRRIRELRDQTGCAIETGNFQGDSAYRLTSKTLGVAIDRTYLTATQKKNLFKKANYTCAACGCHIPSGQKGLEADHKIPLSRGGGSELSNWQPLCTSCNVAKRRSCQSCEEDCNVCAWAFPEQFGQLMLVRLSKEVSEQLIDCAREQNRHSQDVIADAIRQYLSGN